MNYLDRDNFERRLSSGVQVWPCSLWRNEWRQRFSIKEMGCGELLSIGHGHLIEAEYIDILKSGVDALVTGTFGANAIVMQSYGAERQVRVANRECARIAFEASHKIHRKCDAPLIIGSLGPTTTLLSAEREKAGHVKAVYLEQAEALLSAGIRTFHIEGCRDPRNAHCALDALNELEMRTGVTTLRVVTMRTEPEGTMVSGTSVGDFWETVSEFRVDGFGVVGQIGGVEECFRQVSRNIDVPLIAMVDIRDLNSPEMPMLHSYNSFASSVLELINRFKVRIVGTGMESHPAFLSSLHQLLAS